MRVTTPMPRGRLDGGVCWLLLALIVVFAGCQSSGVRLIRDNSGPFAANNTALIHASAQQELAEAKAMMRSGEYSNVIPRLTSIVSQYPDTEAGKEAWYFLGLTYFKIDGLYNADRNFRKYLELAPDGKYAALSREYLAGMEEVVAKRYANKAALEARVAKYDSVDEPEELAAHLELANVYWNNTEYEKAGVLYTKILKVWPSLKDDAVIRQRMERGPDGKYIVLTPAEVDRRYADAEPLAVFNTQSWRSGRYRPDQYDYSNQYYNVSGQVVNRADYPLRDVSIIVTVFGFGGRVYDSRNFQIGRMNPGETRAFSVRFTNFDNIENVQRYECVGTYLR